MLATVRYGIWICDPLDNTGLFQGIDCRGIQFFQGGAQNPDGETASIAPLRAFARCRMRYINPFSDKRQGDVLGIGDGAVRVALLQRNVIVMPKDGLINFCRQ